MSVSPKVPDDYSQAFDREYWGESINISRWGGACGRGAVPKETGAPVAAGTKNQVRKFSGGRKKYIPARSDVA